MMLAGFAIPPALFILAEFAAKALFVVGMVMTMAALLSWVDRKQSALMQDRLGANRADITVLGHRFTLIGLVHMAADGIKGFTKEDYVPPRANPWLHFLAPLLTGSAALAAFAAIPFGGTLWLPLVGRPVELTLFASEVSLLVAFGLLALGVFGLVLAGLNSGNKLATIGSVRAAAQALSYDAVMALSLTGVFLLYGSLDLSAIARAQEQPLTLLGRALPVPAWGVLLQPVGFLLFLGAAAMACKRIPFDLPEAESEIVGFNLEYSGMKFLAFMMTEYVESVAFSFLIVLLFFGGWSLPFVACEPGHSGLFVGGLAIEAPYLAVGLLLACAFAAKILFFVWLFMQARWTLVRFRWDQMMGLAWKAMLPLALANLLATAALARLLK